ncbi:MAG: PDZ domain-containing protein [Firmicutes bacterium]|nr:PDZ domain-containing protein [Bacillota bacterium]
MKKLLSLFLISAVLCCGCMQVETGTFTEEVPSLDAAAVLTSIEEGMDVFIDENFDAYFWYMNDEEYTALMDDYYGEYSGIGVTMMFSLEMEYPLITSVNKDSPAFEAGIQVGESIVAVNGEDVAGWSSDVVASKIKGEAGTDVVVTIRSEEGAERQLTLTRRKLSAYSVEERLIDDYPQLAYIAINSFTDKTDEEFAAEWKRITAERDIKGLIIDLRNNGGGTLSACVNLAANFLNYGDPVLYQKTSDGTYAETARGGLGIELPVVILQNEYSASASEVFLGAMLDHKKAVSVGTTSYGKGITQTIITLLSGRGYRYTASLYYTPSMFSLHGVGITPTYELELSEACTSQAFYDADYKLDNQLAKAIELLTTE